MFGTICNGEWLICDSIKQDPEEILGFVVGWKCWLSYFRWPKPFTVSKHTCMPFGWSINDLWLHTLGANCSDHFRNAATALSLQFNMPMMAFICWWFIYKWARTQDTLSSDFRAQPSSRYRNFFFEKPFAFGFGAKKLFIIFLHLDIERMKEDSIMKRTRFLVPKEFFQRLFLLNVLQQKPSPSKQKGFLASAANKERELPLTVAMMTKLGNGN